MRSTITVAVWFMLILLFLKTVHLVHVYVSILNLMPISIFIRRCLKFDNFIIETICGYTVQFDMLIDVFETIKLMEIFKSLNYQVIIGLKRAIAFLY